MSSTDSATTRALEASYGDSAPAETDATPADAAASRPNAPPIDYAEMAPLVAAAVIPLLAILTVYLRTLTALAKVWDIDPNYSHGFIVPLFSIALGVVAWNRHGVPIVQRNVPRSSVITGCLEIAFGLGLHVFSWFIGNLLFDVLALICILRGTVLAIGGSEANRVYGFPILFLIFMAPLPQAIYEPFAIWMQEFVSVISSNLLESIGIAVYRQGYIIDLPGYRMEVGAACSGLRQLIAILALAVAIGYLSGRGTLYSITLALLAAPIAVAANCIRVFGTGLILLFFGKKWADGVWHTLEGLVMVGLAAVIVVLTAWGLAVLQTWLTDAKQTSAATSAKNPTIA